MSTFELTPLRKKTRVLRQVRSEVVARYDLNWSGWKDYFDYWDNFVANWYDSKACPEDAYSIALSRLFKHKNEDARLIMGELPEPYYGNPHCSKGVIVHLNPGASDDRDISKLYPDGKLVDAFAKECGKKYSEYSKKYSSLARIDICGSDWWHKNNRVGWMTRFFGAGPEDVFALEACPYHSKGWESSFNDFAAHVVDRVIAPALAAASSSMDFPCAVFVGDRFFEQMARINGMLKVGDWSGSRSYGLYSYEFPSDQNCKKTVYAVVIKSTRGMWLPQDNAANRQIEDNIKEIISTGVPRSSSEVKVFVKDVGCKTSAVKRPNTLQRVHNKRPQKLM